MAPRAEVVARIGPRPALRGRPPPARAVECAYRGPDRDRRRCRARRRRRRALAGRPAVPLRGPPQPVRPTVGARQIHVRVPARERAAAGAPPARLRLRSAPSRPVRDPLSRPRQLLRRRFAPREPRGRDLVRDSVARPGGPAPAPPLEPGLRVLALRHHLRRRPRLLQLPEGSPRRAAPALRELRRGARPGRTLPDLAEALGPARVLRRLGPHARARSGRSGVRAARGARLPVDHDLVGVREAVKTGRWWKNREEPAGDVADLERVAQINARAPVPIEVPGAPLPSPASSGASPRVDEAILREEHHHQYGGPWAKGKYRFEFLVESG